MSGNPQEEPARAQSQNNEPNALNGKDAPEEDSGKVAERSRRFQFSMGTMFLVIFFCGIAIASIVFPVNIKLKPGTSLFFHRGNVFSAAVGGLIGTFFREALWGVIIGLVLFYVLYGLATLFAAMVMYTCKAL